MANLTSLIVNDTGYIKLPSGTADQRPPATTGRLRYNTSRGELEINTGTVWKSAQISEPSIVTYGLVLHLDASNVSSYPGTGTTWTDLSGNGNNGTLTNGPTYSSANNGSIVFDGVDDYMVTSNVSNFRSICMMVNKVDIGPSGWKYLIDARPGYGAGYFTNNTLGGWSNLYVNGVSVTASWANLPSNTWFYLYTEADTTYTSTINFMSRFSNNENIQGKIGSIQIYNRALSATEIQQNFEALRGRYSATYPRPPGAPTITSVVPASTTSVTVSFTAPTTGGTPTSYTAYSSGGQSATVTQSGSGTITITGLATSTYYTFYVVAFNGDGNSPNSNTVGCGTPISFTATNSSYAIPASSGTGTYTIYAIGGGGGGGAWSGGARWYGAGGGSGRYSTVSTPLTSGATIAVTIGAGGAGYTAGGTTSVVLSGTTIASATGGSGAPSTGGTGGAGGSGGGCAPSDYNFTASQGGYNGSNGANGATTGGAGQLGVAYGSGTNAFIPPGGTGAYLSGANPWGGIFGIGAGNQAGSNEVGIVPGGGGGGATWGQSTKAGNSGLVVLYRTA